MLFEKKKKKEGLYKKSKVLPSGELEDRALETMGSRGVGSGGGGRSQATVHRTSHGQRNAPLLVMCYSFHGSMKRKC